MHDVYGTWFPAKIPYTPMNNTPLQPIPSVCDANGHDRRFNWPVGLLIQEETMDITRLRTDIRKFFLTLLLPLFGHLWGVLKQTPYAHRPVSDFC